MVNGQLNRELNAPGQGPLASGAEGQMDRQLLEKFARCNDGAAFETLVQRHGPMVLAVCQRVLQNSQDAEDAFQATFLVLVRKAGSIGQPELLANWLYGVAYRTALKARANAARRSEHERQAVSMPSADPLVEVAWRELRALLDEELSRLPEKYRAPLVLCYLQGKTNEEAARQLGWPIGSMSARLARGREMLRDRLASRNRALPAGLFLMVLSQKAGAAALPAPLVGATVKAGVGWAVGKAVGVSPAVQALAGGGARSFGALGKLGKAVGIAALIAIILTGVGAAAVGSGLIPTQPCPKITMPPPASSNNPSSQSQQGHPQTPPAGASGKSCHSH
jgi:RNA polymerase sigma factor (sigma-70 family)